MKHDGNYAEWKMEMVQRVNISMSPINHLFVPQKVSFPFPVVSKYAVQMELSVIAARKANVEEMLSIDRRRGLKVYFVGGIP